MSDENTALAVAERAAGKPRKYAHTSLYSWVNSKRLPKGRAFQKVRRELAAYRLELIAEYGGERISPQALALVDATVEAMGVVKILGLYTRQFGVINSQAAKRGSLELTPLLSRSWLGYQNMIRQNIAQLEELHKNRGRDDENVIPLERYIEIRDREIAAEKAARVAPEESRDAPGGQADATEGPDKGEA